ncbi:family 16 glycoside hydrolase [Lignipirellula cremea]|uniref:3-keto-alpha-glucoside-1,2-lyase/3-keto-2-hydroxy-glucal hydratase domain-containing protein n=1 Tax=Lignipirellula cremea TaxID=2528010 RepID=A0A518DVZ1_9BACT|nr:family 16 glycoside hydrolase [Lignipirellula cremea]QDU95999.1 hypothetical protein Pla8534_38180 [Lignipirellula cremea]
MRRFLKRFSAMLPLGVWLFCGAPMLASAAGPADKAAIVDPEVAQSDVDFLDAGEYRGSIRGLHGQAIPIGLQVSAEGNGEFRGALFRGGLPGSGWDRELRSELTGSRWTGPDTSVRLTSADHTGQFVLAGGKCQVLDVQGEHLGDLRKVIRRSPTEGLRPASESVVLFDGSPHHLASPVVDENGLLEVGFTTAEPYNDFRMHVEFRTPYMPLARGQSRGNSGVYIQQRYETQILDSFSLPGVENECGGLYRQRRPDLNMAFPPLTWQTYDIFFQAPHFNDAGEKIANARLSLYHNGVAVHDDVEIVSKTGAGKAEGPQPLPILFQNHRDPVRFRNIWVTPGTKAASRKFSVHSGPVVKDAPAHDLIASRDADPRFSTPAPTPPEAKPSSPPNDQPSPSDLIPAPRKLTENARPAADEPPGPIASTKPEAKPEAKPKPQARPLIAVLEEEPPSPAVRASAPPAREIQPAPDARPLASTTGKNVEEGNAIEAAGFTEESRKEAPATSDRINRGELGPVKFNRAPGRWNAGPSPIESTPLGQIGELLEESPSKSAVSNSLAE